MLRKLALSLAIAGAIGATNAHALGLGEIRVNSALNEPLNAEIKLLQMRDLSPMQIRPRMADIDEFSLAGMSKSRFLTDVSFQVRVLPDGTGVIEMRSTTPIKEPFLNFLVEVNWPSGRLVREYTLLLDPPVFDPTPVRGVVQPAQAPAPVVSAPAPAPRAAAPRPAANVSNIKTRVNPNSEVFVEVHDTMWQLAMRHRPDRSVTGEQMMLALLRKNPDSFPTGNINVLKAGTVMKIPTLDQIRSLSRQQAAAEVARQTQLWKQGRSTAPAPAPQQSAAAPAATEAGAAPAGKPVEPAANGAGETDSQLKIVTPEGTVAPEQTLGVTAADGADASTPAAASAAVAADAVDPATEELVRRNEDLENRLLMTQETVDKVERENAELGEKLDSIVSQLDKMTRLIELRDQELAALQQRLEAQAQTPQSQSGGGMLEDLTRNPGVLAGIGGAVVALLLGALMLGRRKRRSKEADAEVAVVAPVAPQAAKADSDALPEMVVAGVAAAAAAGAVAGSVSEPEPETPVSKPAMAPLSAQEPESTPDADADELSGLDLDMDMDLDLAEGRDVTPAPLRDEEFDLGVDETPLSSATESPAEPAPVAEPEAEDIDSALDDLLAEPAPLAGPSEVEPEEESALDDALDAMLAATAAEPDLVPETAPESSTESAADEQLDEELDFAVNAFGEDDTAVEDEVLELPDELEFSVEKPAAEAVELDAVDDEDDLAGLDFAVTEPQAQDESAAEDDSDLLEDFFAEEKVTGPEELAAITDVADEEPLTEEPLDLDAEHEKSVLDTIPVDDSEDTFELDEDLEAMLQASSADLEEEEDTPAPVLETTESSIDDLDALLASFDPDAETVDKPADTPAVQDLEAELEAAWSDDDLLDSVIDSGTSQGEQAEEELTANIAHDLELDLDSEIDELLGSTDDEIALDEERADAPEDDLDTLNLLEGADEIETKLDLARAYIEMDDADGARDILKEIVTEGNHFQRREAEKLLEELS